MEISSKCPQSLCCHLSHIKFSWISLLLPIAYSLWAPPTGGSYGLLRESAWTSITLNTLFQHKQKVIISHHGHSCTRISKSSPNFYNDFTTKIFDIAARLFYSYLSQFWLGSLHDLSQTASFVIFYSHTPQPANKYSLTLSILIIQIHRMHSQISFDDF